MPGRRAIIVCVSRYSERAAYQRAYRATHLEAAARQRLVAAARSRALARLADRHRAEFTALVHEERLRAGVPPGRRGRRPRDRQAEAV